MWRIYSNPDPHGVKRRAKEEDFAKWLSKMA
jgi:hypothetical protein